MDDLQGMTTEELRRIAANAPGDPDSRSAIVAELRRRAQSVRMEAAAPPTAVRVVDITMPFGGMVVFMVKWALASIPAVIILFVIGWILALLSGGVIPALLTALLRGAH